MTAKQKKVSYQKHFEQFREFITYLKTQTYENNVFIFILKHNTVDDFIKLFKKKEKQRFFYINDAMEYVVLSNNFDSMHYSMIIDKLMFHSCTINKDAIVKFSKLSIYMILLYGTKECIDLMLDSNDFLNYDDLCQIAVDTYSFDVILQIFDKVKITDEQFNIILDFAESPIIEDLITKCMTIGLFPDEDKTYKLLERGVKIDNGILAMYNIVDDTNIKYILAKIRGGGFDFKRERSKRFKFDEKTKEVIKTEIFNNLSNYTEKNLDAFTKMFDIKYDDKCLKLFCEKSYDHKIFKYLVEDCGLNPDYKSMCTIVSKLSYYSQVEKFF